VERATQLIQDGQRIRVHGTDGYVELLARPGQRDWAETDDSNRARDRSAVSGAYVDIRFGLASYGLPDAAARRIVFM
jgi:hypothetical protein